METFLSCSESNNSLEDNNNCSKYKIGKRLEQGNEISEVSIEEAGDKSIEKVTILKSNVLCTNMEEIDKIVDYEQLVEIDFRAEDNNVSINDIVVGNLVEIDSINECDNSDIYVSNCSKGEIKISSYVLMLSYILKHVLEKEKRKTSYF